MVDLKVLKKVVSLEPFETINLKTLCRNGFPIMEATEYLESKQGALKETSRTIDVYVNNLKVFYVWLEQERYLFEDITVLHLKQYLSYLQKQGLSEGTVYQYYSTVIRFIEWCIGPEEQEKLINENGKKRYSRRGGILKGITGYKELGKLRETIPKKAKVKPKFIVAEEVKVIRDWIKEVYDDEFDYPYKTLYTCIFEILVGAGVRKGELLALTLDSLLPKREVNSKGEIVTRYYLKVQNSPESQDSELAKKIGLALKTGERIIPITSYVATSILKWKSLRPIEAEHNLLFANLHPARRGDMFSQYALKHLFNSINNEDYGVGLENRLHPHMLRHTYATLLISKVPLDVVQTLLGHSSIDTTTKYTHMDSSKIREFLETAWEELDIFGGRV